MLFNDVPYGKIIEAPFPTKPLKMLPGFPVTIPWIVVLTAAPIFPATLDSDFLRILPENLLVISDECFHRAGFSEIQVCPVCCPVFGRWQWHFYDYVWSDFGAVNTNYNDTPQSSMKCSVPCCLLCLSRDAISIQISLNIYN